MQARGKDLGSNISKVSLGHERGFKILPGNDTKMLSHDCRLGKSHKIYKRGTTMGIPTHCHLR
jgi:hypothetical protein